MFLHNNVELLLIAFLFIKGEFSCIKKWEQNYISKLHNMMAQILMS